jgi:hypothetical protein
MLTNMPRKNFQSIKIHVFIKNIYINKIENNIERKK